MHDINSWVDVFGLTENCDDEYIYHFDERSPEEIEAAGGFDPWGDDLDLYGHASGENIENKTSGYVSTSKVIEVPQDWATGYDEGYIYVIKKTTNGVDVNAVLGDSSPFKNEQEIAVPNKIPYEDVVNVINPYN